jgi:hypothetical protein
MAIAHVCLSCGFDLARIRARIEPIYRLPLVTCPRCGVHAVRRRHPIWRTYRTLLRVDAALTVLLVQFVLLVALLVANVCGALAVGEVVDGAIQRRKLSEGEIAILVAFGLIVPIATGTWLTAGLAHWRRFAGWSAFFLSVALILFVAMGAGFFGRAVADHGGLDWLVPVLYVVRPPRAMLEMWKFIGMGLMVLPAIAGVAVLGIPVGIRLRRLGRLLRSRRWRWRRRRRRLGGLV